MGFAEEVRANPPRYKRRYVERALGDECPEFIEALADPDVEVREIHEALARRNLDVSLRTVTAWASKARPRS